MRVTERVVTPSRAVAAVVLSAAVLLGVSQFVDYRGVGIGVPLYEGIEAVAPPPQTDRQPAGSAHSYILLPVAVLALGAMAFALRGRWQLGRAISLLGVVGIVVSLLIDIPAGLDEGEAALGFEGAEAMLVEGFWVAARVLGRARGHGTSARPLRASGARTRCKAGASNGFSSPAAQAERRSGGGGASASNARSLMRPQQPALVRLRGGGAVRRRVGADDHVRVRSRHERRDAADDRRRGPALLCAPGARDLRPRRARRGGRSRGRGPPPSQWRSPAGCRCWSSSSSTCPTWASRGLSTSSPGCSSPARPSRATALAGVRGLGCPCGPGAALETLRPSSSRCSPGVVLPRRARRRLSGDHPNVEPATRAARGATPGVVSRPVLPAVVREGLVGLSHAVHVVLALPRATLLAGRVEDLVREPLLDRLLAPLARELTATARRACGPGALAPRRAPGELPRRRGAIAPRARGSAP